MSDAVAASAAGLLALKPGAHETSIWLAKG
jgi:hypothetical protein